MTRHQWQFFGLIAILLSVSSCGTENSGQIAGPQEDPVPQALSKPVAKIASGIPSNVMATVTQNGEPISNIEVAFAQSVAGQTPGYEWTGTTGAEGIARVAITTGASGYFLAKATDPITGQVLGQWGSIPINQGRSVILSLPIAQPMQIKRGVITSTTITSTSLEGNLLGDPATRPITIYLPPSYDGAKRFPVVYLLHGYTGNARTFVSKAFTGLYWPPDADFPRYGFGAMLDDLIATGKMHEVIVVMPDGSNTYGGSFYSNSVLNGNYEDYIAQDVVQFIDNQYSTIASANSRAIAGHSMGGYGAMKLAMRHPNIFGAVACHSAPLAIDISKELVPLVIAENPDGLAGPHPQKALTSITYAESAAWSPNLANPPFYVDLPIEYPSGQVIESVWSKWQAEDPLHLLDTLAGNLASLRGIYIDVGDQDDFGLNFHADAFHQALIAAGIDHEYEIYSGNHFNHLFEKISISLSYLSNTLVAE